VPPKDHCRRPLVSAAPQVGVVRDVTNKFDINNMPALLNFDLSDSIKIVRHMHPLKLVEFALRLGGDPSAGISIRFEGRGWKPSGINLLAAALRTLVDRLPSR
jgi:hypothetical protein